MKKFRVLVILIVLFALALPVTNLFAKPNNTGALGALGLDAKAVAAIPESKCVVCHTAGAELPYYAGLPVASGMMQADIENAREYLDWNEQAPDSEVALAKLERVVEDGSMPPLKYKLAHWDAGLTADETAALLAWIHQVRAEGPLVAGHR